MEIITIIVAVIACLSAYFAWQQSKAATTSSKVAQEQANIMKQYVKENKISSIVENYIKLSSPPYRIDSGLSGLVRAGITELANENEVRDVVEQIKLRNYKNPLQGYEDKIKEIGFLNFFIFVAQHGITKSIDEIVNKQHSG